MSNSNIYIKCVRGVILITVSLMSNEKGELKKFFDNLFEFEPYMDDCVIEWICVYKDPVKSIKYIDKAMENLDDYKISLWVKIGEDDIVEVTKNNKKVIKNEIMYIFRK